MDRLNVDLETKLTVIKYRSREEFEANRPYSEETTIHQDKEGS